MIRKILAEETYKVRQEVLRPGRPLKECFFEGDLEEDSIHLGYFVEEQPVAVATFVARKNAIFETPIQYQLRGMAVLPSHQDKKLGEKLLLKGEELLKSKNPDILLWFNARETAVAFYKKYGYTTTGPAFMIPNVCMHVVMYKTPTKL
ncbi:GNAT family N-acetyltransferase [Salinimicrobium tongyeongense]|uniref:GNAT family N-acetyltransferase n=1 Tax=Salinimicrobium tongyeongense TaxID=2809707 RepID=A0ABY6NSL0_9FLAO|nr:GNAT family N-acetyltransferase [Salinimicrobium tongyeongense]UZH55890.1 GNAT family N-acetyltransferase [Salinimicrobium tongyeongense]